ncbi:hypothetical protein, partial [Salinispora arenicola]|uniref:hypothetical protein n=1 Tax=Salinispora arenicola TaxID=168697 RepID=UPI00207AA9E8
MAAREVMEGGDQSVLVQRPVEVDGAPDVVGEVSLRVQHALDPQSLLAGRCRQHECAVRFRDAVERGDRWCTPLLRAIGEVGGEVGEGGVFEDEVER